MRTHFTFGLVITSLMTTYSHADFIGVHADASYWNVQSTVETANTNEKLKDKGAVQLSVAVEHPVPVLPNVKVKYVNIDTESKSNALTQSTAEFTSTDFILYYEILDTIVSADVGLGASHIDSSFNGTYSHQPATYTIDGYAPSLYAQAGVKLPFTGLSLNAEALYSELNKFKKKDFQAEIQYNFVDNLLVDVGAKIGYRVLEIDGKKDNSTLLNAKFKGPYIGLNVHF